MVQVLPLPDSGYAKRALIEMAFEDCGTAGFEFGETPEEMTKALRRLNVMMLEWPWSALGYAQPVNGGLGDIAELSNIPTQFTAAVASYLALRLAPTMGKTLSPEQRVALSRSLAQVQGYATSIPSSEMPKGMMRGAGNRNILSPFFAGQVEEPEQVAVDLVQIAETA